MSFDLSRPGSFRKKIAVFALAIVFFRLVGPAPVRAADEPDPEKTKKTILRFAALLGPPLSMLAYGRFAWKWGETSTWRWSTEKNWGYRSDSGGSDKFGHAFAHYVLARTFYDIYHYTEDGRPRKWLYAALSTAVIGTLIEVGDAFTDEYGFSWGDMAANFTGIALGLFLEASPKAAGLVGFSWEYFPSEGFRKTSRSWFRHFTVDNSGWRFLLNLKPSGLEAFNVRVPKFLRYVTLDLGFFVKGYTEFDRSLGLADGRFLFVGASVNVSQILRDLFKNKGFFGRGVPTYFEFVHLPLGLKFPWGIDD